MKRAWIPPTVVFPAIAVGLLVLAFLYYYFPERIRREDALNRQAFRQLGTVSDSIQSVVSSYGAVLERWANAARSGDQSGKMTGFADQVPDLRYVSLRSGLPSEKDAAKISPVARPPAPPSDCALQLTARSEFGQVLLHFQCGEDGAEIAIETLVQRYIKGDPQETFDEFLVADSIGNVLYQTARTGLHLRNLATLLAAKGDDKKTDDKAASAAKPGGGVQQASDVVKLSLGGAAYRLYSSPAPIRLSAADTTPALDLVLYGLVSEENVRKRALSTPGSVQITVGLAAGVLLVIAWPLLKFRTMRASERVPRRAGLYFFVSCIVTIALLMILANHLWYQSSDFDDTKAKLERLAEAIDINVSRETQQAVEALGEATNSRFFLSAAEKIEDYQTPCGQGTPHPVKDAQGNILARLDFPVAGYPYFDQMFWADKYGYQQIKWTVHSTPTPATRLCQFNFFTETLQGHLWHFETPQGRRWHFADTDPSVSFRIDPVYSPNTGEYQAIVSQSYEPQSYEQSGNRSNAKARALAMRAMVTPMLSLIHPVAPPGYGFAMVDESGLVLFHSIAERNGHEQLFDEVEGDPAVRAAVFARTGGHLVTNYHGAPYRFFVRPLRRIQDCPWTLITFRDLRPLAAMQLERTILLLVLTIGYLMLVCLFAIVFIRPGSYPRPWLWPQPAMNARYIHTTLTLLALTGLMYLVMLWASMVVSFVAAMTSSVVAIGVVSWKLQNREDRIRNLSYLLLATAIVAVGWKILWLHDLAWWRGGPLLLGACLVLRWCASVRAGAWLAKNPTTGKERHLPDFSASYTAMALSLLLLVPALPCLCFFRIAYDYQENMFTRRTQLETMAALEDRVERVLRAYARIKLTDSDGKVSNVFRASFLRARMDDVQLDRYDTVFGAGSGLEFSPRARQTAKENNGNGPTQERESHFWQPLQQLAALSGDPYASAATFLNERDARSTQWRWTLDGNRHLRLGPRFVSESENSSTSSPPTAALARLAASNPVLISEDLVSELQVLKPGFWETVIPLIVVGGFMYLLFGSTIDRMFLLRVAFEEPWPEISPAEAVGLDRNLILSCLPRPGQSFPLAGVGKPGEIFPIDLAEWVPKWMAAEAKKAEVQRNQIDERVILLDHFEFQCQDPEVNRIKLEILEWLIHQPGKRVLIVTAIDPVLYLFPGPFNDAKATEGFSPGKYLERWFAALTGFDRMRLSLPQASAAGHWADDTCTRPFYYQLLWADCSRSERVALYQLAHDGLPNHQNWRALNHLLRRGLIERTPVIRIADDSFCNYILTVVRRDDIDIWERGESITMWDGVRIAFWVLAAGFVVAISIYNQQQVVALITTLVAVVPALGKLFSDSIGRRAGKTAERAAAE